ncbi:MAG TPA: hypothetical protein VK190_04670 [Pseudoneobacillus sp.]|nr:hypothetical protein [Pseudoneobacillus sp.]
MSDLKSELSILKEIIEMECGDKVRVVYAEKPGWLLLKTVDKQKGIGAIRLNKNSFITLYLDTKEGIKLEDHLKTLPTYEAKVANIQSKQTGNFVQNKIKLFNEDLLDFVTEVINKVFNEDMIQTGKRIRTNSQSVESMIA